MCTIFKCNPPRCFALTSLMSSYHGHTKTLWRIPFFLSVVSVKLLENMVRRGTKAHNETEEKRWKPPMWNFKKTNSYSKRVNESFSENSVFDGQFHDWYFACLLQLPGNTFTWLIWFREDTMVENEDNDRFWSQMFSNKQTKCKAE